MKAIFRWLLDGGEICVHMGLKQRNMNSPLGRESPLSSGFKKKTQTVLHLTHKLQLLDIFF